VERLRLDRTRVDDKESVARLLELGLKGEEVPMLWLETIEEVKELVGTVLEPTELRVRIELDEIGSPIVDEDSVEGELTLLLTPDEA